MVKRYEKTNDITCGKELVFRLSWGDGTVPVPVPLRTAVSVSTPSIALALEDPVLVLAVVAVLNSYGGEASQIAIIVKDDVLCSL